MQKLKLLAIFLSFLSFNEFALSINHTITDEENEQQSRVSDTLSFAGRSFNTSGELMNFLIYEYLAEQTRDISAPKNIELFSIENGRSVCKTGISFDGKCFVSNLALLAFLQEWYLEKHKDETVASSDINTNQEIGQIGDSRSGNQVRSKQLELGTLQGPEGGYIVLAGYDHVSSTGPRRAIKLETPENFLANLELSNSTVCFDETSLSRMLGVNPPLSDSSLPTFSNSQLKEGSVERKSGQVCYEIVWGTSILSEEQTERAKENADRQLKGHGILESLLPADKTALEQAWNSGSDLTEKISNVEKFWIDRIEYLANDCPLYADYFNQNPDHNMVQAALALRKGNCVPKNFSLGMSVYELSGGTLPVRFNQSLWVNPETEPQTPITSDNLHLNVEYLKIAEDGSSHWVPMESSFTYAQASEEQRNEIDDLRFKEKLKNGELNAQDVLSAAFSENREIQELALEMLPNYSEQLQDEIPKLIEQFQKNHDGHDFPNVGHQAIDVVAKIAPEVAVEALLGALGGDYWSASVYDALQARLARLGTPARERITRALPESSVPRLLLETLKQMVSRDISPSELTATINAINDFDGEYLNGDTYFGTIEQPAARAELFKFLKHSSINLRLVALNTLKNNSLSDEEISELLPSMADSEPSVRIRTIYVLMNKLKENGVPHAVTLSTDSDPSVRIATAQILTGYRNQSLAASDAIERLAIDSDRDVRHGVLGMLSDEEEFVLEHLAQYERLVKDSASSNRYIGNVVRTLSEIDVEDVNEQAVDVVIAALGSDSAGNRYEAANVLGSWGGRARSALRKLRELENDGTIGITFRDGYKRTVGQAAAAAIRRIEN